MEIIAIDIAHDFSDTPGARYISEGPDSGELFRRNFLEPFFKQDIENKRLTIILDGTAGYATSFLEEAFGGLARLYGKNVVLNKISFISNDDALLVDEIISYIKGE